MLGLGAWLLLVLIHVMAVIARLPPAVPWYVSWGVVGFCAAQVLSVGAVLTAGHAGLILLLRRWAPGRAWALPARHRALHASGVVAPLVVLSVGWARNDFAGLAERHSMSVPPALTQWGAALVLALGLVLVIQVLRLCRGRWLSGFGLSVAVTLAIVSATALPLDYPGLRLPVVAAAGLALSAALVNVQAAWTRFHGSTQNALAWRLLGASLILGPSVLCGITPNNATRLLLASEQSAVLKPLIDSLRTSDVGASDATALLAHVPAERAEWFRDRRALPDRAPDNPRLLPHDGIVILFGIDALRADVLAGRHDAVLPAIARLRNEGVWFTQARSPGASTVPALSSMFSGVYYSSLQWQVHPKRPPGAYPHHDPTPRFPETLAAAGVRTLTVDTSGWLTNEFGVVRGFTHEWTARRKHYPRADQVGKLLLPKIAEHAQGRPLFAFVHFLDAHAPYDSGGKAATPFDGYLRELSLVDAQLAALRDMLQERQLASRTCIILYADHGESFGEHGHLFHAATLYDTLLRVPLIVHCPGLPPRSVAAPVSLMDVGPTISDLLGVPSKAHVIGQSLVGLLRGEQSSLTRPILAEARLKQALISDGYKIIYDTQGWAKELYDLERDPGELHNLYTEQDELSQHALGQLRAFFQAHTYRAPGYAVPYRKW